MLPRLVFEKWQENAGYYSLLNLQFVTSVELKVARVTERSEKTCFSVKIFELNVLSVFTDITISTLNTRQLFIGIKQ